MNSVTLGLSIHRPEMIPYITEEMKRHDAIFLEEPPSANFRRMLYGSIPVESYLMELDIEYPVFSKDMCYLLRELYEQGKKIFQTEPYLEALVSIHEFFAEGHSRNELSENSLLYPVYIAERNATGALMAYYQAAMTASFDKSLEAVLRFARMDARRFRMRDSLRVQELAPLLKKYPSGYIEAGQMHYPIYRLLRKQITRSVPIQTVFLADAALKNIGESGHLYGPGDQLTLLYIFHPDMVETMREKLLAARSMVYSKIIHKDEITDGNNRLPHLSDEIKCIRSVNQLSVNDCRQLFQRVRRSTSHSARQIVTEYLSKKSGKNEMPQFPSIEGGSHR